jgi:[ribosomal protein S5]-alanine N-acetyltransferase
MFIAETRRMLIRPLSLDDVPELAAILADAQVMHYSLKGIHSEEDTRRFVEWCLGLYRDCGYGPWALVERGSWALVGFCGLSPETVGGQDEVHVGYRLARRFWGCGLATEAVSAVLADGFARGLASVVAIVQPAHGASIRVLEKAGFSAFEQMAYHGSDVRVYRLAARAAPGTPRTDAPP